MTLEEYIQYRTGSKIGSTMLRNIFIKPFVASSFRSFWKYWNPSWGYYLLFYCYKPVRNILPHWASLIITFVVCGLLHDLIYIVPMMINGRGLAFPFIAVWFLIISIGILLTDLLHIRFDRINLLFRPIIHLGYFWGTFSLARAISLNV